MVASMLDTEPSEVGRAHLSEASDSCKQPVQGGLAGLHCQQLLLAYLPSPQRCSQSADAAFKSDTCRQSPFKCCAAKKEDLA